MNERLKRAPAALSIAILLSGPLVAAAADKTGHTASLSGSQAAPPTASAATAQGFVVLNAAQTQITVVLSWSGLAALASGGHIHGPGAAGVNAPILFDLAPAAALAGSVGPLTFAVTAAQATQLKTGLFYFDIHSGTFPAGEIRGQIGSAVTYGASMSAAQEVPKNASTATGSGKVFLNAGQTQIAVSLDFTGLSGSATMGHIHGPGATGANAPVLFDLSPPAATAGSVALKTFPITMLQAYYLQSGLAYFNVHTATNSGGEIRGQAFRVAKFYSVTPCRVADTRDPVGAAGPPFMASETRDIAVAGLCGVPPDAASVAFNVTVVGPEDAGYVTVYPSGQPQPTTSTVNFAAGQTRANSAIIGLGVSGASDQAAVSAFAGLAVGQLDLILDVVGYLK